MPFFPEPADLASLAAPNVAYWFQMVGVGVSIYSSTGIDPIHNPPSISAFELEHGREQERYVHNSRSIERVKRDGRAVLAEHAGFWDLFVPVGAGPTLRAVILTGPFSRTFPSAEQVRERWQHLTGHPPLGTDPEFSRYVEATFATPVLDSRRLAWFERLLSLFAALLEGRGDVGKLRDEARELQNRLATLTRVDKLGEIAASMLGERTARSWSSRSRRAELGSVGVTKPPDQLLVGLLARRPGSSADAVEDLLARHGFLRAVAELGKQTKDLVWSRLGERGVVLLVAGSGTAEERKSELSELAERAIGLAERRFGLRLHVGVGAIGARVPFGTQFERALRAAEAALARGRRVIHADAIEGRAPSLADMRRELGRAEVDSARVSALFDRYAEAASLRVAGSVEGLRAHLEAGFERACEALIPAAALENKALTVLFTQLDLASSQARTTSELTQAFRVAVGELVHATREPEGARREQSVRRAVDYIRVHYTDESLTLNRAARIAGFARARFSELLRRELGVKFTQFVAGLRIERAKQLLMTSDAPIERVARLAGFGEPHYFHRVFRRAVGTTPRNFRARFPLPPELATRSSNRKPRRTARRR